MQQQHPVPAPQRGIVIPFKALAVVLGVLVIAAAIAVPLWQFVFTSSSTKPGTAQPAPKIHLDYPKSWTPVSPSAVKGVPASAAAVLQRKGNSALLVVLRGGPAKVNSAAATKINNQLKAKYSDYRFDSVKAAQLPHAGRAMVFTYVRTRQGILHTIVIIPAGRVSFVLEAASPPQNKAIGREIGAILKSATLTYPKK